MTPDKPEPKIEITIDDTKHTLFMSFGLLNRLMKAVGIHVESLLAGGAHEVREQLFAEALNKRGKSGVFVDFTAEKIDDIEMSSEEAQRLLMWILDHVVDFFLGVAERTKATAEKFEGRTEALTRSKSGTPG